MNEKIQSLGNKCFRARFIFCEHKNVYCVYTRNLGANLWLLLGAKSLPFGYMSMAPLGAKNVFVGCKVCGCWVHVYGYYWVHVCGFWVHVYGAVGCMPDSR